MSIGYNKIYVAVITVIIGAAAVFILEVLLGSQPQLEIPNEATANSRSVLSVCQLIDSPKKYDGKMISFEATAHVNDQTVILLPKNCWANNYFTLSISPEMKLANFKGRNNHLTTLLGRYEEIDVRVTGVAKTSFAEGFSTPIFMYSINPTDIQFISPIRHFEPRVGH